MKHKSDSDLLEFVKKDNHMAFTELVNRYWKNLYKHVYLKIKDGDETQDIVQELFLSLWKNRMNIVCDEKQSLSSYLYKAAKYASINYFSRPGVTLTGANILEQMLSFPSSEHSDERVLYKELHNLVNVELNELPERLQVPYRMSREQNMTIREIAIRLSLSEQTVKNNITAALHRIRFRLGKYNSDATILFIIMAISIYGTVN